MGGYWIIRTYESGPVGEKIKYWVPGQKPTKSKRRLKAEVKKARQNKAAAERQLARLLNANFSAGDILLTLDYSDEVVTTRLTPRAEKIAKRHPAQTRAGQAAETAETAETAEAEQIEHLRQAAERELENYILRVQRACKKKEIELKYIAVTSDMDGETGEMARVHHHLVINREAMEIATAKWTEGGANTQRLSAQPDYTPVAAYLMAQVRHIPDAKKYKPSRNLVRPQPKDRVAVSDAELRLPAGCAMLYRSTYTPGATQYIRYILRSRKKDQVRAKKPKPKTPVKPLDKKLQIE